MTDSLKLTSYFGERQRCGTGFVAHALLELYGRHEIAASILLRGTEGFGLKHHLRTAGAMARSYGFPGFEYVIIPHPVASLSAGQIRERAHGLMPDLLRILGVE